MDLSSGTVERFNAGLAPNERRLCAKLLIELSSLDCSSSPLRLLKEISAHWQELSADPTGAAIPNAKVTITEVATNLTYEATTNSTGEYVRPALKPGIYTVTAEAKGFRRVAQENVVVTSGDRIGVPLILQVGDVNESIEVTANAPLLQTENTSQGADLNPSEVSQLPMGGQRVFSYLARLSPGVLVAEPGARDAQNGGFSANGVRSTGENNFLLNGVDNNVNVIDFINQTSYVIGPSLEAIGEIRILTNGYNAEYGRAAGGVVDVILKSGTNGLHGVAVRISAEHRSECQSLGEQFGRCRASAAQAEPVRRHGRRTHHQEQAVHVRRLSGY